MKQASRAWCKKLRKALEHMGFKQSLADPCLFIGNISSRKCYLVTYVDDTLIFGESSNICDQVKKQLMMSFDIRDLGKASYFLGLKIERNRDQRTLNIPQKTYITAILKTYRMLSAHSSHLPMQKGIKLSDCKENEQEIKLPYRELIGCLMYISVTTRPDISFAVGKLAGYFNSYSSEHWNAAKNVLRYLKSTIDFKLVYGLSKTGTVDGFSDSDWAEDRTRKSTSGYVFRFNGGAISWRSKLQSVVAASSTEAEYIAQAYAAREALWIKYLCTDFGIHVPYIYQLLQIIRKQ